jgi:hypothetical protein
MKILPFSITNLPSREREARPVEARASRVQPVSKESAVPAAEAWQATLTAEEIEMVYAVRAIRERHHQEQPPSHNPDLPPPNLDITLTVHESEPATTPSAPLGLRRFQLVESMSDDTHTLPASTKLNLYA